MASMLQSLCWHPASSNPALYPNLLQQFLPFLCRGCTLLWCPYIPLALAHCCFLHFCPLPNSQQEDREAGNRLLRVMRATGVLKCQTATEPLQGFLVPCSGGSLLQYCMEGSGRQPRIPLTPPGFSPFLLHRKCCLGRAQAKKGQ